jgi:uncharacterized protein
MADPIPMNGSFTSGGLELQRYLAVPVGHKERLPGLVVCHGFPVGPLDARQSAGTFPELVDRIANEGRWAAMTFTFRGCGNSEGDFSLQGWIDDLRAAVEHLITEVHPTGIWLVGTHTGGSLATCVAAADPRIRGVGLLGARADFEDWASQPRRFLEHAREIGAIRTPGFPRQFDEWAREFRRFRPTDAARRLSPRPMLVMHGSEDESVPTTEARQLAQAHSGSELRILDGAGHRLRHDPRAVAILLGWLDRQRNQSFETPGQLP